MSNQTSIEERLTAMERAVHELADRLDALQGNSNWLQRFYGAFDDMPESEFETFVRLGREFRHADRPQTP